MLARVARSTRDDDAAAPSASAPVVQEARTAPFSRLLLTIPTVAFLLMYLGIGQAVLPARVPVWFPGQRGVSTLIILGGAALTIWALVTFRSWRFLAKLDRGHQLVTNGPFRLMRHPIYMGLNLLALGSAVWVPTMIMWAALVLMFLGGDLRARAEEKLLEQAFGEDYKAYCARTRRFIPRIY